MAADQKQKPAEASKNYKGFVAGVFSGIAKLTGKCPWTTLLVDGGTVQPAVNSSQYYLDSPTNHYSRLVHGFLADGKGYAFPYDDVNANGANTAGVLSGTNAQRLEIIIS